MTSCETTQNYLADADRTSMPEEVQAHLESCADCQAVLAQLQDLESAFEDLDIPDAPDALVAETLAAVRKAAAKDPAPAGSGFGRRYLAGGLAASLVITAGLGLALHKGLFDGQRLMDSNGVFDDFPAKDQIAAAPKAPASAEEQFKITAEGFSESKNELVGGDLARGQADQSEFEMAELQDLEAGASDYRQRSGQGAYDQELDIIARLEEPDYYARHQSRRGDGQQSFGNKEKADKKGALRSLTESEFMGQLGGESSISSADRDEAGNRAAEPPALLDLVAPTGEHEFEANLPTSDIGDDEGRISSLLKNREFAFEEAPADEVSRSKQAPAASTTAPIEEVPEAIVTGPTVQGMGGALYADDAPRRNLERQGDPDWQRQLAQGFLARYQSLEGLAFQEPRGYWANSYIPGDPAMRLLQARLDRQGRTGLGQDLRVEQTIQSVQQPFDAPQDAAMALYLDAETSAINGPTRLRLQVGLKGAERQGGHRPAMNVGLVIDLRDGAAEIGTRVRALIKALNRARNPEDRFSLTLAGPGGGLLVTPDQFRHGALEVALAQILAPSEKPESSGTTLREALDLAFTSVRQGDDPSAVLGSSLVLLVTGSSLADDVAALERLAFENAVGGVALSVTSLAGGEELTSIERLVAAGQGNRRVLATAQDAEGLIDRELHAASRAVARALRLSIRLAPGVQLIDVLGSRRLGEPQAQQVREAEQSIDQRLSRNLGIEADRGDDEEGIQIVIPNFYAGDAHVILLDLVADAPGPLAEVTLRFKDVVQLKNGSAQASLSLANGEARGGPLQDNVIKNLVARTFSDQVRLAAGLLRQGRPEEARAALESLQALIAGLSRAVPGWSNDPDLAADEALLTGFLANLAKPAAAAVAGRGYLADSLRYAAFRKLQTATR